jgi:hypothetical protein
VTTGAFAGLAAAALAGTLLCAGAAKMAVPVHLSRTIRSLLPGAAPHALLLARLVAGAELGAALALSVPATRNAGAVAGIVLGAAIAATGAAGAARRLSSSCGCFGRAAGRPLGLPNVASGVLVIALSALLLADRSGGWAGHDGLPMLGSAAVALALTGWLHRAMIKDLFRPLPRARAAAAEEE